MPSQIEPMKKVARRIREHPGGIMSAMALSTINAGSGLINTRVQCTKRTACGLRNRQCLRNSILFHINCLRHIPASLKATHRNA